MKRAEICLTLAVGTALSALAWPWSAAEDGAVVSDGKAVGEIVIPRKSHEAETYAGAELQKWIGELTDAYVPLVYPPQTNAAAKTTSAAAASTAGSHSSPLAPLVFIIRTLDGRP